MVISKTVSSYGDVILLTCRGSCFVRMAPARLEESPKVHIRINMKEMPSMPWICLQFFTICLCEDKKSKNINVHFFNFIIKHKSVNCLYNMIQLTRTHTFYCLLFKYFITKCSTKGYSMHNSTYDQNIYFHTYGIIKQLFINLCLFYHSDLLVCDILFILSLTEC